MATRYDAIVIGTGQSGPSLAGALAFGFGLDRGFDVFRSDPKGNCDFRLASPWRPLAGLVKRAGVNARRRRIEPTLEALAISSICPARLGYLLVQDAEEPRPHA